MKTDDKLVGQYLSGNYAQIQNIIRQADTKANIIIALIGVILSLFFNFFVSKNLLPMWQVLTVLSLFFISGGLALSTLFPRTSKKTGKFSLTYYKDAIYVDKNKTINMFFNKNSEKEILEDYIDNIKILSKILDKKFLKLKLSYTFFGLAIIIKVIFELLAWLQI